MQCTKCLCNCTKVKFIKEFIFLSSLMRSQSWISYICGWKKWINLSVHLAFLQNSAIKMLSNIFLRLLTSKFMNDLVDICKNLVSTFCLFLNAVLFYERIVFTSKPGGKPNEIQITEKINQNTLREFLTGNTSV